MARIGETTHTEYPPYPDNDKDRLDLIFTALNKQSFSMWVTISTICHNIGWSLPNSELHRLENVIIGSGLLDYKANNYFQVLKLNYTGRSVLAEFGAFSKYVESLRQQEKVDQENENLRIKNLQLQNKVLELELANKDLDKDLKSAQYLLTELQRKELKTKRWWAIGGAIGTFLLTKVFEHAKEIWQCIHG